MSNLPEGIDNPDMTLAQFIAKHRVIHSFLPESDARSKNEYVADMIEKYWMPAFPHEGGSS